mmetsp:Transcript_25092/g.58385  ORF Transcript_25092/g.58385 Transcript_25092/m.58385 type:complete len:193 (+) Transcript_25092:63-641(+)
MFLELLFAGFKLLQAYPLLRGFTTSSIPGDFQREAARAPWAQGFKKWWTLNKFRVVPRDVLWVARFNAIGPIWDSFLWQANQKRHHQALQAALHRQRGQLKLQMYALTGASLAVGGASAWPLLCLTEQRQQGVAVITGAVAEVSKGVLRAQSEEENQVEPKQQSRQGQLTGGARSLVRHVNVNHAIFLGSLF